MGLFCAALFPFVPAMGAQDDSSAEHWAYRSISVPAIPRVENPSWCREPLDRFVLARLERAGRAPAPMAERRAWLRRVYYDLLGLPPSFAQVQRFLDDPRPDACERVVDALLARPEFGERWGRHWLDVARYADTKGYVDGGETKYPFAWVYRDYVVRAFNADLPFDRFVLEQLAADRLEASDSNESLAALGFLTVGHRFNFFPHEVIDDRIDVVTRGFMGLTISCARCHDHKYDPIPTEDYYSLYGIFANSVEASPDELPVVAAENDDTAELREEIAKKGAAYRKKRHELHDQIRHEMRAWVGDYLRYIVQKLPEHRTKDQAELRTERGLVRDRSAYARGAVVRWRRYIASRGDDHPIFGIWNRIQPLKRGQVAATVAAELQRLEQRTQINPLLAGELKGKRAASLVGIAEATSELLEASEGRWRKHLETHPDAVALPDDAWEELRQALYDAEAPGSVRLDDSEDLYTLNESVEVRSLAAAIEKAYLEAKAAAPRAMVVRDREEEIPAHVFVRGNPENRGALVPRRFPRLLAHVAPESFIDGSGRLELARAIIHPENPLTARVIVNRVWAWHFGAPLVDTPSDFGVRSVSPSHPALLDFLATDLMTSGWSLKALHRSIVLSSTYRQSSVQDVSTRRSDPANRLLGRMNRRRLGFEAMRDSMLYASGRLDRRLGGLSSPLAPDDPAGRRRTLYSHLDRERLESIFRVFDFPSPELSSAQRPRTTVPQQALFLLNNRFVATQAESLVTRLPGEAQDVESRVQALYRTLYQRDPEPPELELARAFLASRKDHDSTRAAAAAENDQIEAEPAAPETLTVWGQYAQALLQANEFLFID